jgi:hypothetical protein
MMKPKILIIGSGTTVLNYQFKELIDSFETVVRFHGFHRKHDQYSEFIGTKTDIVICNTSKGVIVDFVDGDFYKGCPNYIVTGNLSKVPKRVLEIKNVLESINFKMIDTINVKKPLSRKIHAKLNSSGMSAIDYFLNIHNTIAIHGFDMVDTCGRIDTMYHYFEIGKALTFPKIHDLTGEKNFILELIAQNKVVELKKVKEK